MITLVLDTQIPLEKLAAKFRAAWMDRQKLNASVILLCPAEQKDTLTSHFKGSTCVTLDSWRKELLSVHKTPWIAYLPGPVDYSTLSLPRLEPHRVLQPWFPLMDLPEEGGMHLGSPLMGWVGSSDLLEMPGIGPNLPNFRDFENFPFQNELSYISVPADASLKRPSNPAPLSGSVLALVPYFQCRPWLENALSSLVRQTRPLDGILVLDDASEDTPIDIVKKFPNVTLWRAKENSGPYRLVQTAIEKTGYDFYFFQDADDWSTVNRLENSLLEMGRTGADAVACQEIMYLQERAFPNAYPLDVNAALDKKPIYSFLHPGSLVKREFIMKLGGYASGLRFSGDLEFQLRARYAGKLVASDRFDYYRRIRPHSLVTSETTGLASPARQELDTRIKARAAENATLMSKGQPPRLEPLEVTKPVGFEHLAGPDIKKA